MTHDTHPPGLTPVLLPVYPELARTFGYRGEARWVAFSWTPAGDEVFYDDGQRPGTGASYAFLAYRRHPAVRPHLEGYNLDSSDCEAEDCLLLDQAEGRAFIATLADARSLLHDQHLPPRELTPAELQEAFAELDAALSRGWQEVEIPAEEIARALADQAAREAKMRDALDQWVRRQ
jgi:hypothetical protein